MVKKISKKQQATTHKQQRRKRFIFAGLVIVLGLAATAVIIYQANALSTARENDTRKDRIEAIYSSLNLGDEYIPQFYDVFGDKRPYDYDASRSMSSQITYVRGANVDTTVADLSKKIKDAGFVYFEEPYPGSTSIQYHYKSDKGEYVRLSVSSKLRDDAFQNVYLMTGGTTDDLFKIDPNAGPSNATIKVNLDDNNE